MATGDPADSMFNDDQLPRRVEHGPDQRHADLYAVLTGRVSSIGREARIGEDGSTYNHPRRELAAGPPVGSGLLRAGLLALDADAARSTAACATRCSCRSTPEQQLLHGDHRRPLRHHGPGAGFVAGAVGGNYGNLFKPGVSRRAADHLQDADEGHQRLQDRLEQRGAQPRPGLDHRVLRRSASCARSSARRVTRSSARGYNLSYQRGGMSDFTEVYGNNPGIAIDATRNVTNGNLGTLPVLFRSSDLGAPAISLTRVYPMAPPTASSNVRTFDPDITVPWSESVPAGHAAGALEELDRARCGSSTPQPRPLDPHQPRRRRGTTTRSTSSRTGSWTSSAWRSRTSWRTSPRAWATRGSSTRGRRARCRCRSSSRT